MYSLPCIFRKRFFTLFYELKACTFIGMLRRNANLIRPNDYPLGPLRNNALDGLPHLSFSITVSFVFRQNTVVTDFC